MIEQKVRVLTNIQNIEELMNKVIREMNESDWLLTHITSHFSNKSTWTLLFEREVKDYANECRR